MAASVSLTKEKFEKALISLEVAKPYAKSLYQTEVYQQALELSHHPDGLDTLYEYADRFEAAGVFHGGPWQEVSKLQPPLVGGSLRVKGVNSVVELLSELRLLAIGKGKVDHPDMTKEEACAFLNEVLALNLNLLFPAETEEARVESGEHIERAQRLMQFLGNHLSLKSIADKIVYEIMRLSVQRPIMVKRIVEMIHKAEQLVGPEIDQQTKNCLEKYIDAVSSPTPLSKKWPELKTYRRQLSDLSSKELTNEAEGLANSMKTTGLVSLYHALFIRYANRYSPEMIPVMLDLTEKGEANFNEHRELVYKLIQIAIHPGTRQAIYGLAALLNKGVLSNPPVIPGLSRLLDLDIHPEVKNDLLNTVDKREGLTANAVLTAGTISVLGQPLGIGQGLNPTCQSARGISLWAQHGQGHLLELIARAARDRDIDMTFEGEVIHSSGLEGGLAPDLHKELDVVSLLLVPHLDRIYDEMMKRTLLRGEDGHKWVNPEFYGEWISRGFANVLDPITGTVHDYSSFVRLFYASHHPDYNEGYELIYPNPVGIFITNVHGKLLGLHAVSVQRIAQTDEGEWRIYFYNPNNDSSQDWGQGIKPAVWGHEELEGECSLPFEQFASRLYAFHYNPYEQGDAYMVDDEIVGEVEKMARESWGQEYQWT
ncbi:MAG TPA: hypothetical protein VEY51_16600 [Chondromyces sp.]|nr:hypothetical protein [Chondromyces sp.]